LPGPTDLLFGILIPAVVAGILLLVDARFGAPRPSLRSLHLGAAALGAGYLIAHAWLVGVPASPLGESTVPYTAWIFWMVAAAIVLAPLRGWPATASLMRSLYPALFCVWMHRVIRGPGPHGGLGSVLAFGAVLLVFVLWKLLERLAERKPGPSLPLALWAACAGTSVTLLMNKSGSLAQLVGAVCAGLGAAVVLTWIVRDNHLARGSVAIVAIVVASAVRIAVVYDLPTASWVLLAVAFALPWLSEVPGVRARSPRVRALAAFLGAAIPSAAAALVAAAAREPSAY